jgi:hypothetical protein
MLAVGLALAACYEKKIYEAPTPTDPQVASILLEGQCRVDVGRIVCEDRSQTVPAGELDHVSFTLRNSTTGISLETRSIDPNGTPPRQASFAGLAAGRYEVEHSATAKGGARSSMIYPNLVVGGL